MKYEMLKCQKMFSKIMRKCTGSGTESGQAWRALPRARPGPWQKCLELWTYTVSVRQPGTRVDTGHMSRVT